MTTKTKSTIKNSTLKIASSGAGNRDVGCGLYQDVPHVRSDDQVDNEGAYDGIRTSSDGSEGGFEIDVEGKGEEVGCGGGGPSTLVYMMKSTVIPRIHPPSSGFLSIIRMTSWCSSLYFKPSADQINMERSSVLGDRTEFDPTNVCSTSLAPDSEGISDAAARFFH